MSEIPERWREVVDLSQRSPNHRNWHDDLRHCAEELGVAEAQLRTANETIERLRGEECAVITRLTATVTQQAATIRTLKIALEQAEYVLSMAGLDLTAQAMRAALANVRSEEKP